MDTRKNRFLVQPRSPLEIHCDHGSVTVRPGPEGAVSVTTVLRHPDAWSYSAEEVADGVRVEARVKSLAALSPRGLLSFMGNSPRADIEVFAPPDMTVTVVVANATVDVEGMHGNVSSTSSKGGVRLMGCRGAVQVRTSNGQADLEDISGSIRVKTSNGAVTGTGLHGAVDVQTSNGRIELDLSLDHGSVNSVRTTNGSVSVSVAGAEDVDVSVSTVNGRTSVEVPSRVRPGESGQASLNVRTTNGSVKVIESKRPVYV